MASSPAGAGSFDISRVISRAFQTIGANAALFFGLSLILSGVPSAVFEYWQTQFGLARGGNPDPEIFLTWGFWSPLLGALLVGIVTNAVLQAALTRATVMHLSGETPGIGQSLAVGLSMLLPMIVIGILSSIAIGFAMLLLIVPGIILWLIWSVTVPVYVQERVGPFGSFGRSAELTSGARASIFLLMLAVVIGLWVLSAIGGAIGLVAMAASPLVTVVISALTGALGSMVMVTVIASIYVELRDVKDGIAPGDLEAILRLNPGAWRTASTICGASAGPISRCSSAWSSAGSCRRSTMRKGGSSGCSRSITTTMRSTSPRGYGRARRPGGRAGRRAPISGCSARSISSTACSGCSPASGYLDLGIFLYGPVDLPLTTRFFANLPHLAIGGAAAWVGYIYARRA